MMFCFIVLLLSWLIDKLGAPEPPKEYNNDKRPTALLESPLEGEIEGFESEAGEKVSSGSIEWAVNNTETELLGEDLK